MKRIFPLILPIIALIIVGCSSDDTLEVEAIEKTEGFTPVGNQVEVTLSLSTLPFTVDEATRAETPDSYSPDSVNTDEQNILYYEQWIRNFWVFEYDKETGKLIGFPQYFYCNPYITATGERDVKLSDNNGKPVIIYVVANADVGTGSTVASSSTNCANWVVYDKTTKTYPGFDTIEDLEKNTLPTTYISEAQRSASNQNWPPYYYKSSEGSTVYNNAENIPKSGSIEVEKVEEGVAVTVSLTNMYAKLMLYVDFSGCDLSANTLSNSTGKYVEYRFAIDNIPNYCTVGALATAETTTRGEYPSGVVWGCYGAPYYSQTFSSLVNLYYETEPTTHLLETIYVPENIQGDNSNYNRTNSTYPPAYDGDNKQLAATLYDNYFSTTYSSISVYDKTDALAIYFGWQWSGQHYLGWYGPVFPGGNTTTNFNMRRNCTYRVIMHITTNGLE